MRNLEAVAQLPHQLPAEFREVDILINNAGLALGVTTVGDHDIEVC
jgi:NADP-dependent 3-hydroxy acid dehydrogenase YdfG